MPEITRDVEIVDIECPKCAHIFNMTQEITIDWEPSYPFN